MLAAFLVTATIICQADFNGDKIVDGLDVDTFVAQFGTAGPEADLNGDGIVNGLDVGPFIEAFGLGCKDYVTLTWIDPTLNEDGTPYLDPAGVRVYVGDCQTMAFVPLEPLVPHGAMTATVEDLTPDQEYCFAVTAVDTSNNESVFSTIVSHIVGYGSP